MTQQPETTATVPTTSTTTDDRPLDLSRLYHPRGLALVGATEGPSNPGQQTLRLIDVARARGAAFYPISATRETVHGVAAYRSLVDVPGPVDVAVYQVGDPAAAIDALPDDPDAHGVPRFAVVFTAGYSEMGTAAAVTAQQDLLDACRKRGIRLVGPNTNLNAFELRRREGTLPRLGLVAQSGAQGRPVVEAEDLGIEFSYWAPTGNEADLESADFFEFLARDPDTAAIAAYIEGFVSGQRLREAALEALEHDTPIALIKVGRSDAGRTLAVSHTAHLTGSDAVHDAFFEQYGITRVEDVDELREVATALARTPLPPTDGVVLWGISGGAVVHLADLADTMGLPIPRLSEETQAALRAHIPDYLMVHNPVDNGGHSLLSGHGADDLRAILSDPATGVLVCSLPGNYGNMTAIIADAIEAVRGEFDTPIIAVWASPTVTDPGHRRLLDMGIPVFSNARNALAGARALLDRRRIRADRETFVATARALPPIVPPPPAEATLLLDEADSMAWLAERGVPVVAHRAVTTVEEAVAAADDLGYPVVLKGRGSALAHKTDLGLVRVGIADAAELRSTADAMLREAPHGRLDGFVVAEMVRDGLELLVGLSVDDLLGPVVTIGAGGVHAEAWRDVAVSVLPVTPGRARDMVARLRISPLLDGWRGGSALDRDAVERAVLTMARIAAEGEAVEIDVNPLAVTPTGVVALDALVRLRTG